MKMASRPRLLAALRGEGRPARRMRALCPRRPGPVVLGLAMVTAASAVALPAGAPALARPIRGSAAAAPSGSRPSDVLLNGTAPFFGRVPSANASSLNNTLFAVSAVSGSDVWAVGDFNPGTVPTVAGRATLTEHWNGSSWRVIPSPNYVNGHHLVASHLRGVDAIAADNVWAVGYAEDFTAGTEQTLIEHWNGTAWSIVPSPSPGGGPDRLLAVDGIAAGNIWAVGQSTFQTSLIEHWNGSAWQAVSSPCQQPQTGVVQISATDAWSVSLLHSCHFDGTSWHAVPIAVPQRTEPFLFAVAASAPNDVWAVGEADVNTSPPYALPLVEHWNGATWTADTNVPARTLHGIDVLASNNIYAVGDDEAFRPVAIHWDGHSWSLVATPKPPSTGTLYAAETLTASDIWGAGSFFPDPHSGTKERTITVHAPTATQGAISGVSTTPLSTITWVGPVKGSTTTDKAGRYAVSGLPPGQYAVINSYSGCASDAASEAVAAGAVTVHNFHICS